MAVVRVKRHLNEDPVDALLIACKRRKTEDDHLTSIFKFAATVANQDENVSKYISKEFRSSDLMYKPHNITNITDKLRAENKLFSQNSRLKVVNCFRALSDTNYIDDSSGPSKSDDSVTIVEIESLSSITTDGSKSTSIEDSDKGAEKYVYDIYYAQDCKLDDKMLDNPISCHILDDLVLEDCFDDVYCNEEDSDDSNDESNWRNDYPDEDPDSIGEEDMKMACQMGNLNLNKNLCNSQPKQIMNVSKKRKQKSRSRKKREKERDIKFRVVKNKEIDIYLRDSILQRLGVKEPSKIALLEPET